MRLAMKIPEKMTQLTKYTCVPCHYIIQKNFLKIFEVFTVTFFEVIKCEYANAKPR